MCGILGILGDDILVTEVQFLSALDLLNHRGPDNSAVWCNPKAYLGHTRLSVIDLRSNANQPMFNKNKDIGIVFNGEIYNYQELSQSFNFNSTSDTQVLLRGYEVFGLDFFKKIRGIYAFCINDQRGDNCLSILGRDPGGVKPLYYHKSEKSLIFSSEIKALIPLMEKGNLEVNIDSIRKYIHLGYCPEPKTAWQNISCLLPGSFQVFDHDFGTLRKELVLEYSFDPEPEKSKNDALLKGVRERLAVACQRNLIADVEVNVALSGGIDSSLIYYFANQPPHRATGITIAFEEDEYDERQAAKSYAAHLEGDHLVIPAKEEPDNLALFNRLLDHFDQPFADSSFIPFYILSKTAAAKSKVLVGGDSGDEVHNGYSGYQWLPAIYRLKNSIFKYPVCWMLSTVFPLLKPDYKRAVRKILGLLNTKCFAEFIFYWESWFPPDESSYKNYPLNFKTNDLSFPEYRSNSLEGKIQEEYFIGRMLGDYLRKSDMMSMLNHLEFRVPMLDEDFVRYSLKIPYLKKSNVFETKRMLRSIHAKLFPRWLSRLPKKGFTIPLDTWLGENNLKAIECYLVKGCKYFEEFIDPDYVEELFEEIFIGNNRDYISRASAYQRMLIIYSLERWLEKRHGFLKDAPDIFIQEK